MLRIVHDRSYRSVSTKRNGWWLAFERPLSANLPYKVSARRREPLAAYGRGCVKTQNQRVLGGGFTPPEAPGGRYRVF